MFDFDEIEDDVQKKGKDAWAEADPEAAAKLQEAAAGRSAEMARAAAAAAASKAASGQKAGGLTGGLSRRAPAAAAPAAPLVVAPPTGPGREELVGGLKAAVWRLEEAPAPGQRQKPAVVICAGNPSKALGASHMSAPLIAALYEAVVGAGFPAVRFDYRGVGRNAEGAEWVVPGPKEACEDALSVARWAQEHIGAGRVVMAGYSFGTSTALSVLITGLASAFVALSCGTEQWRMFEGEESARRKEDQARHSKLRVPAIYVCGEKDWITDQSELARILAAREDGGRGTRVEVLPEMKHELAGKEAEAGALAVAWLREWWAAEEAAGGGTSTAESHILR